MPKTPGKLIVIEGTDGTGKATQAKLLYSRLLHAGYSAALIDFPQYNSKSAGLVEEYLEGKYGEANDVDPYIASMFYAIDRYDAAQKMKNWISNGKIIIANRYLTSNMAHQGSKLNSKLDRRTFYDWLYNLEYRLFKIPVPDDIFVLHIPALAAQQMAVKRDREDWRGKQRDIHEGNLEHLARSEQIYLEIAKLYNNIKVVNCTKNGELYTREFIAEAIWQDIRPTLPAQDTFAIAPDFKDLHENNNIPQLTSKEDKHTFYVRKLTSKAILPIKNKTGSSFEVYASDYYSIFPNESTIIRTGLSIQLPIGYIGQLWSHSHSQLLKFFDNSHSSELIFNITNNSDEIIHIAPRQKIADLYIQKTTNPKLIEQ